MELKRLLPGLVALLLNLALYAQVVPDSVDSAGQEPKTVVDSLGTLSKTFPADSADTASISSPDTTRRFIDQIAVSKDTLDAPVVYNADDSIVYDIPAKKVFLYGNAVVTYKEIKLKAEFIELDWNTSIITAETERADDSTLVKYATFSDGSDNYEAKKLMYNFKTKKGKVFYAKRLEDGQQLQLEETKRNEHGEWYGKNGLYTTCTLDHPHYYIGSKKMKLVPDKVVVTGPANLVVADVPTPLFVPFGMFPLKKGQRSGIVLPEYGEERNGRGFFFRGMGYYFGFNDYIDMLTTGDIYTNGSWGLKNLIRYKKRYKFNGSLQMNFGRTNSGEREDPDFRVTNDFRVNWRFNQESQAHPLRTFTASAEFGTRSYNQNFTRDQVSVQQSQFVSKINFIRKFPDKPLNFSVGFNHNQSLVTNIVDVTFPDINFGVSTIRPFKRKISTGKTRWYETISLSYRLETKYTVRALDSLFLEPETFRDNARYGMRHTIPINASFKVFKYFTLNPNITYRERWYLQSIEKSFDPDTVTTRTITTSTNDAGEEVFDTTFTTLNGQTIIDTLFGFNAARDFNMGINLTTKIYGQYNFKGKIKAIRHVMTPQLSFSYRPDFATDFWGYYERLETNTDTLRYSRFEQIQSLYGQPTQGAQANIGLNITNNLQMKVFNKADTVNQEKKINLIDQFSISSRYNVIADSNHLAPISMSMSTTILQKFNFRFTTALSIYEADQETGRLIDQTVWNERNRLTRLTSATFAFGTRLQSGKRRSDKKLKPEDADDERKQAILASPYAYIDYDIPWSIDFDYNLRMTRTPDGNGGYKNEITANAIQANMVVTLTPKWAVQVQTGFNFEEMELAYTRMQVRRDLHCWEMSFNWTAYPVSQQSYSMQINVKSSLLQDLKLTRKSSQFDRPF